MYSSGIYAGASAFSAVRALSMLNRDLADTERRISTGLKIGSAKDDGAIWAIAQKMRSSVTALDAVADSLDRGKSTVEIAMLAGETVSTLLGDMKAIAVAASDPGLQPADRTALNTQFTALRDQLANVVSNASLNGVNMISAAGSSVSALADTTGTSTIVVGPQSLALGGANVTVAANASFNNAAQAQALVAQLDTSMANTTLAVARLGSGAKALDTHLKFVGKQQDTLEIGVDRLVKADLEKESARLSALKAQQELATQVLAMANARPSLLVQLFKQ